MVRFYTNHIKEKKAWLEGDEYIHCIKSLRHRSGDKVHFIDGDGKSYHATIQKIGQKEVEMLIIQEFSHQKPEKQLHIAISPLKSQQRFEWFLEKATELGISEISPIICERTEKRRWNEKRGMKILISAMKQSLGVYLPKLNPLLKFREFLTQLSEYDQKYMAHYKMGNRYLTSSSSEKRTLVLIGPEGDFSDSELDFAAKEGFQCINLSDKRLRTETAGVVTCVQVLANA